MFTNGYFSLPFKSVYRPSCDQLMMDPIEDDFVNDEPLGAEQKASARKRRRRPPSVLEPPPRRREQIGGRTSREMNQLFLSENYGPVASCDHDGGFALRIASAY